MLSLYVFAARKLHDLRDDCRGVTAMEYGLIAAVMVGVCATAWGLVSAKLTTLMTAIAADLVMGG